MLDQHPHLKSESVPKQVTVGKGVDRATALAAAPYDAFQMNKELPAICAWVDYKIFYTRLPG
jgi:hypothetical protein